MEKLEKEFYVRDTITVAKELIGKYLAVKCFDEEMIVRIVETEGYIGPGDKACHAYNNRRTKRTETMYCSGGCAYVYQIYGMHYCFNVVTEKKGVGTAVLIRSAEPIKGLSRMSYNRYNKKWDQLNDREKMNMVNGPGKLCKALRLDKSFNGESLFGNRISIFEIRNNNDFEIEASRRVNIEYSEEARDFMWRFYIKENPYVSKK